uniref:TSA: Wollemia nobilis Ref_Wollemi_Transcript_3629_826 transcribed RNA sequence n=1 Tax=Wollemia nobilis TaxID=56998 RepID=A0A0C9RYK9_9CONI
MDCIRFSISPGAGHMGLQSTSRCGATLGSTRGVRFITSLSVVRAVQVSGVESRAVPAAEGGGHMKKPGSLYEVLGVSRGATAQDVKRAYRKLARQFHPDTAASPEAKSLRSEMFMQIQNAYAVLSKPEDRAQYDRKLVMQQSQRWSRVPSPRSYGIPSGHVGRNWETDQCW